MPITLVTGTPGAGKSLMTLFEVERRRKAEGREVYYSGIADLLLPWHLFGGDAVDTTRPADTDPSEWYKLPKGSIIVIDEAQRLFRIRAAGSKVPEFVSQLETHRHKGYDIYLVTQHPALIDTNVRKLADRHLHLMRKFGSKWATIHEWKGVKDNCDKSRKDSMESEFVYPKEVFSWYKSAEVHTVKRRIPKKVIFFLSLPLILLAAVFYAYQSMARFASPTPVTSAAGSSVVAPLGTTGGGSVAAVYRTQPVTAVDYVQQFQPRLEGLYHTASRYDALTAPAYVPVPVGCVLYDGAGTGSFCVTQQGTRFVPPLAFVKSFVERGFFLDFEPDQGKRGDQRQQPTNVQLSKQ